MIGTSRKASPDEVRDGIRMIACDVTSDASVAAAASLALAELGQIDLLVNNAGYAISGAAEESSIEQVHALFDTNFLGVVRVTNAVLPIMRQKGFGRILNIGSVVGLIPGPFGAYYTASKHAIEGYSESLDHEVRPFGIRVAVIEPWATKTSIEATRRVATVPLRPMVRHLPDTKRRSMPPWQPATRQTMSPRLFLPQRKQGRRACGTLGKGCPTDFLRPALSSACAV